MNVGILSMQKIHNYGSFLQAFSLKLQMEARGHSVFFIDIQPGRQIVSPTVVAPTSILSKFDKYFFKRIENYLLSRNMDKMHVTDYEKYLEIEKKLPEGEMFDLVIIGSDEVFNATVPSGWGFTTQLFGNVENAKCVVTYAASCGSTTFKNAEKYGIVAELRDSMQNLSHISVRDENSCDFVERITDRKPLLHVDPVFISDFDRFISDVPKRKPYLLVYAYGNRICDEREIKAIKQYAKEKQLEILCVGMQQRWCKHNIAASAFELLSYVKRAECIVTDTFHGTVFSTKFNKRFVSIIRESNRNKLGGLLDQLGLRERSVEDMDQFSNIMDSEIDYNSVNAILASEKQKSYDYLDIITKMES
ncbi:MAG: polysaccharide pyruvyl transferase family protein [Clostridia bacterium]|nr:polysaccharide pyruvyl transferase family protein [Clostridia bacterium]